MARTSRTALVGVLLAAVVGGCGAEPDPAADPLEQVTKAATTVVEFCDAARANIVAARPLADLTAAGGAPRPAGEVAAAIGPLRTSNRHLLAKAPDLVRPDVESTLQLAEMQLTVLESTGGDAAAARKDRAYVAKAAESKEATTRLRLFLRSRCGIDVD